MTQKKPIPSVSVNYESMGSSTRVNDLGMDVKNDISVGEVVLSCIQK